jgi:dTDP-4-amino-4,6-dideoxygalactose transaminase
VFLKHHLTLLDGFTNARRSIASRYKDAIDSNGILNVGPKVVEDSVWHHFVIRTNDRSGAQEWFLSRGVATDIHYPYAAYALPPVRNLVPKKYSNTKFLNSDALCETVLSLPIGPWMDDSQVSHVSKVLSEIPERFISR